MEFEWDQANEEHLARHGVSRMEAEEALGDPFGIFQEEALVGDETRYRFVGSTSRGRLLTVAFVVRQGRTRPVTAFDAGRFMARKYREGAKHEF